MQVNLEALPEASISTQILGPDPTTYEAYRVHPISTRPNFAKVLETPTYGYGDTCILDVKAMFHTLRGHGTYMAGTVNSVPLLKVGWKSVNFPSHF